MSFIKFIEIIFLIMFIATIAAGQGIFVTPIPEQRPSDNANNIQRFARQMQASIESPYGNGYFNNNNNNNGARYGSVYDRLSGYGTSTLDRQNGQIPYNPFEQKPSGFKYPSQFFAAQNAARRVEPQNVNNEYVNPGYQYGQYPYGPGYLIKNYVNQGQYRIKPQPYEPEFYTTTAVPISIADSQRIAQQKENQKWENLRTYGIRQNQEPQGLLQEQLREPWNQSYENQVGLTEYISQMASRGYGK